MDWLDCSVKFALETFVKHDGGEALQEHDIEENDETSIPGHVAPQLLQSGFIWLSVRVRENESIDLVGIASDGKDGNLSKHSEDDQTEEVDELLHHDRSHGYLELEAVVWIVETPLWPHLTVWQSIDFSAEEYELEIGMESVWEGDLEFAMLEVENHLFDQLHQPRVWSQESQGLPSFQVLKLKQSDQDVLGVDGFQTEEAEWLDLLPLSLNHLEQNWKSRLDEFKDL